MIDHTAGRSILVSEMDQHWAPLLAALAERFPDAVPTPTWSARLAAEPERSVRVYDHRRTGF